ncbi:hypothetical protein BC831DRAFT_453758 [Entophlyctis helioformis]|nr:hypothetical protein BC831DRAFT_453758 [Entophlyctis helioformis]
MLTADRARVTAGAPHTAPHMAPHTAGAQQQQRQQQRQQQQPVTLAAAVERLQGALAQAEQDVLFVQEQVNYDLAQALGPQPHPTAVSDRLAALDTRIESLKTKSARLVADKHAFARDVEEQLRRNADLLERILASTEFEGDYELVRQFEALAKTLADHSQAVRLDA